MLELKNLCIPGDFPAYAESAKILLYAMWYDKGRIRKDREQDICSLKHAYDERMRSALDILSERRRSSGAWPVTGQYTGPVHIKMEEEPDSRINTLRALRVLKAYRSRSVSARI